MWNKGLRQWLGFGDSAHCGHCDSWFEILALWLYYTLLSIWRSLLISKIDGCSPKCMNIFTENALKCRRQDLLDDKSSFFQINTELYFMSYCTCRWQRVNSSRLSDAIWWHRTGSTLAQVMARVWRHQAITWANVDLSLWSSDVYLRAISLEIYHSHQSLKLAWKLFLSDFIEIS